MTLHEDVARINDGDTVTAEIKHYGDQFEITGPVKMVRETLALGPFALAYVGDGGQYPSGALLRVIDHQPAPAPLYANRPDITEPRDLDTVTRCGHEEPISYYAKANRWRCHYGSIWTTEGLREVGPLTLVAEAIQ